MRRYNQSYNNYHICSISLINNWMTNIKMFYFLIYMYFSLIKYIFFNVFNFTKPHDIRDKNKFD